MCTAFKLRNCMGRNFDYEISYGEQLIEIPRDNETINNHYSIIGIVSGQIPMYPMFYDGLNDHGLCMAGLNFDGNAVYHNKDDNKENIKPYEMIPYVLGNYKSVDDVKKWAENINILDEPFSENIPNSPLHWFVCDKEKSIVIESRANGLYVHDNPYNVLTNNPYFEAMSVIYEFDKKKISAENFIHNFLTNNDVEKFFNSRGKNTFGIKGDYTSIGRFEKCAFLNEYMSTQNKFDSITESFHLLSSVEQIYGLTPVKDKFEYTIYSTVYNMDSLEVCVQNYDRSYLKYGFADMGYRIPLV